MKIMHLDSYTPDIFGYSDDDWIQYKRGFGPNNVLSRLSREMGWDCSAHYFTRDRQRKKEVWDSLPYNFHPVSFPRLPSKISLFGGRSVSFYRHQLQISVPFLKYLHINRPDIMVINITSGLSCYLVGAYLEKYQLSYIAHFHGGDYEGSLLRHRFIKKAAGIITCSEAEKRQVLSIYKLGDEQVRVIPVGVDVGKYKPAPVTASIEVGPTLLFVGRIVESKGVLEVVISLSKILGEFPAAHLNIVGPIGDQSYFGKINQYIAEKGLQNNVTYLGVKKNAELPEIYASADVFVFPSNKEGNPAVVMESMASETPVISLECTGGANEVILHNKNGLLTTIDRLATDMASLLRDKTRLQAFANNCRQRICSQYSFNNTFEHHKNLYESILADHAK